MTTLKQSRIHKLSVALEGHEKILILTHNNPDPDSVASAWGLQHLIRARCGKNPDIAYSGFLGRAENRTMVRELGITIQSDKEINVQDYDGYILVDVQPQSGNHCLPLEIRPLAVIDHHPSTHRMPDVPFRIIRTRCGSTSTIITELLREGDVPIDARLATALLYGIKSDTRDLERNSRQRDVDAFLYLFPKSDLKLLGEIEHARLSQDYFTDLRDALSSAYVRGDVVIVCVGEVVSRDIVAEMADLFLRLEGVNWSICYGYINGEVSISIRSTDPSKRADKAIVEIVKDLGTGGGHASMAAGRIPITEDNVETLEETIRNRIHSALHVRRRRERLLVNGQASVNLCREHAGNGNGNGKGRANGPGKSRKSEPVLLE